MAGLWGTGDYTFVLARLGPLHLGCNREVAALLRWLLTQVSLYYETAVEILTGKEINYTIPVVLFH